MASHRFTTFKDGNLTRIETDWLFFSFTLEQMGITSDSKEYFLTEPTRCSCLNILKEHMGLSFGKVGGEGVHFLYKAEFLIYLVEDCLLQL